MPQTRFRPKKGVKRGADPDKPSGGYGYGWKSPFLWLGSFAVLLILVQTLEWRVRPAVAAAAKAIVTRAATETLNEAVSAEIAHDVDYQEVVKIDRHDAQDFQVAHLDFAAITRLQAAATDKAQARLQTLEKQTLWLPLSQVFGGGALLTSVGPEIPIRFRVVGATHSSVQTEVTTAGINQTVHMVYLDLTADMSVIAPFISQPITIHSRIPLAYVILAGKVPNTYAGPGTGVTVGEGSSAKG